MVLGEMKPVQGLFWTEKWRPFRIVAIGDEAGIPSMHHLMVLLGVLLDAGTTAPPRSWHLWPT
jgi:hypothetical protein